MTEQLTEEERGCLGWALGSGIKARRIIDAQAARIAELEAALHEVQQAHTNANGNLRLAESELTQLRERVARLLRLWSDFGSQDMYGGMLQDGMAPPDFEAWTDALEALRGE